MQGKGSDAVLAADAMVEISDALVEGDGKDALAGAVEARLWRAAAAFQFGDPASVARARCVARGDALEALGMRGVLRQRNLGARLSSCTRPHYGLSSGGRCRDSINSRR